LHSAAPTAALPDLTALQSGMPPTNQLLPLTAGHGTETLPPFLSEGALVVKYACEGPGPVTIQAIGNDLIDSELSGCGPGVYGLTAPGDAKDLPSYTGREFTLRVDAAASTRWEIYVGQVLTPIASP
jgi:hypothetical protein